ncbi:unnamed protein product [Vicia faba]|uniref:Uncharacterized protein n=1 Tax=Vicia faba TaxID=3906 RepID=A0AAV0ZS39_VICFA|nr:unnamed protein product [Vicia faba]
MINLICRKWRDVGASPKRKNTTEGDGGTSETAENGSRIVDFLSHGYGGRETESTTERGRQRYVDDGGRVSCETVSEGAARESDRFLFLDLDIKFLKRRVLVCLRGQKNINDGSQLHSFLDEKCVHNGVLVESKRKSPCRRGRSDQVREARDNPRCHHYL